MNIDNSTTGIKLHTNLYIYDTLIPHPDGNWDYEEAKRVADALVAKDIKAYVIQVGE